MVYISFVCFLDNIIHHPRHIVNSFLYLVFVKFGWRRLQITKN